MHMRHVWVGLIAVAGTSWLVSCSRDDGGIPTAQELSASLVAVDELEGEWTLFNGPQGGDQMVDPSGILTEEQRELVPSFDLCERASDDARALVESLRPSVFRQLDLAVDDEIDPPSDRTGHRIFLQEFLYSGEPDDTTESFSLIRDGSVDCFGEMPASEEGPGYSQELSLPEVGDDRFGVLMTIEEAGGWAEWHIQEAVVRKEAVLMKLVVVDIRAGVEPYFTVEEFGDIVRLAVDEL